MMQEDTVLLNINEKGVATITLNRPEVHNAFDDSVIEKLIENLEIVGRKPEVRVVVLRSNGKSFSAGADLNWMQRMVKLSYDENLKDAGELARMLQILNGLPKPTIALVQGATFGGAVGLVACCDIALASEKASFCLSEVKIALIPATISPYVVEAMGTRAARRYFLTAERFSAQTAKELGLVHDVVLPEQLDESCEQMASHLLKNGPIAIQEAKSLIANVSNRVIDKELIDYSTQLIAKIRVSEEGQEGLNAFLEKRQPQWINE